MTKDHEHMHPINAEENRSWERQPDESEKAYAHFTRWLALGDRNLVRAAERLKLSLGHLRDLSSKHGWQARAAAYDQAEARRIANATAKDRLAAARAVARDIREEAEARLKVPAAERDPAGVQRLAAALRAITPAVEDPAPTQTVRIDLEGLYAAVRLREQQREAEEDSAA